MNHVLTPFSRSENLIELGNCIKQEGAHWHLLCVEGEHKYPNLGSWVTQHFFKPPPEGFFIGHFLCNEFIELGLVDEDYYAVCTDDDFYPPGFFKSLETYEDDVIVVSMQRSNKPSGTDSNCAFGTLIAAPENIKVGSVGYEQLIVKGKVLKEYRCAGHYEADGDLIVKMFSERMESFRFVPDVMVYFDYLYPGRAKCRRWER